MKQPPNWLLWTSGILSILTLVGIGIGLVGGGAILSGLKREPVP